MTRHTEQMFTTFHRKKLGELDSIQRYLNRKLSATTFQSASEDDCSAKYEQQGEQDTRQLLLQSRQLVGEVNNIFSGELQFIVLSAAFDINNYNRVLLDVPADKFFNFGVQSCSCSLVLVFASRVFGNQH